MIERPLHINAKEGDFAEVVLMPGDPLRAKYIADKFLNHAVLVTSVRNIFGYTGYYKGKKVSVMASGMGMSSLSIYVYELVHFYGVKKIIRIGTSGALCPEVKIPQIILASCAYTESNFAYTYANITDKMMYPSNNLNNLIIDAAKNNDINLQIGTILTSEVFGPYANRDSYMKRLPSDVHPLVEEMEAYGLFLLGKLLNIETAGLIVCTDSEFENRALTPEERQTSLNTMIKLALESIVK